MTTVAKKLLLGTAAFAVAGALISPVVAVADTEDTGSDSVGTSAGNTPKRDRGAVARAAANAGSSSNNSAPTASVPSAPTGSASDNSPAAPVIPSVGANSTAPKAVGSNPLLQNQLWWFGTPNPTPPPSTPIYEFEPLAELPGFTRPMFGWMKGFDFEACVLGLSSVTNGQTVMGPYGTASTGFSSSGCA